VSKSVYTKITVLKVQVSGLSIPIVPIPVQANSPVKGTAVTVLGMAEGKLIAKSGFVESTSRNLDSVEFLFVTKIQVEKGLSGAPAVDSTGALVGMVVRADASGVFLIPSSDIVKQSMR
jgi:S1-C subfamily serine protease